MVLFRKTMICLLIYLFLTVTVGESLRKFDNVKEATEEGFQIVTDTLQSDKTTKEKPFKLESSAFQEALQELCPFPGFHGSFCPVKEVQQQFRAYATPPTSLPRMPTGLGITIDLSTGELKLPMFEELYFDSGRPEGFWTDPLTKIKYQVPFGVKIESVKLKDEIRVFKDELELASIWMDAEQKLKWSGGFYSSLKDVNQLYEKYFSGDQFMSVSQTYKNVLRFTRNNFYPRRNSHVIRAIESLPWNYNETVYNDFISSWGTHVTMDTLLGGMIEKQHVFKDCVYSSPNFSDGLSEDQIQQALKDELNGRQGGDTFFVARRRVSIDHKIGGNPEDVSNWEQTIIQNPALLQINGFNPLYEYIEDPQISRNLAKATNKRLESMKKKQMAQYELLKEQKRNKKLGPQPASAVLGFDKFTIQQPFIMQPANECSPVPSYYNRIGDCRTSKNQIAKVKEYNILLMLGYDFMRYQRDDQGRFRVSMSDGILNVRDAASDITGEWMDKGCSFISGKKTPQYMGLDSELPHTLHVRVICLGCTPYLVTRTRLACSCPAF